MAPLLGRMRLEVEDKASLHTVTRLKTIIFQLKKQKNQVIVDLNGKGVNLLLSPQISIKGRKVNFLFYIIYFICPTFLPACMYFP